MNLSVGDRVVYPNQGVCRVSAVDDKQIAGQTLTFVTMKREEDGAVVMVPKTKIATIGLRKVADAAEARRIFDFLKADTEKADLDWKQRARTNLDRMSQGGLMGLAEVVKGLQVLSELRPLPTKERELYDNARHLLVAELSAALNLEPVNAEDAIDIVLFPPGRERPKRTAEEFRAVGEDEELGELGDDLLAIGGDLDLPSEEEPPAEEPEEAEAESEEEAPRGKGKRAAPEPALSEDDEVTVAMGTPALTDEPVKRKRGRPPKPKPAVEEPAVPKKRGRPPKPKPAVEEAAVPKKRGRPPKPKPEAAAKPKKK
jgi:RNA polymerase-interacting CarD/CdnL/TRCF family regulator